MSNIYKSGIVLSPNIIEPDGKNLVTNPFSALSYTPTRVTNSCLNGYMVMYDWEEDPDPNTIYRIEISVSWSGFDSSNTDGAFDIYFQGSTYVTADSNWQWVGGNGATSALNSKQSLKNLVLGSTSGSYRYNTTFTIAQSWRNSYKGNYVGIRSNFSNGTGKITISDCKVYQDKYSSSGNVKFHIGNNFIAGEEMIEI